MVHTLLVVDDDAGFRDLATRVLTAWGHDVLGEAATVGEALVRADELRPDTILTDVHLPDGDGFALAEVLLTLPWRPRVVLISSDGDVTNGPAARRLGADFVSKEDLSGTVLRRLIDAA